MTAKAPSSGILAALMILAVSATGLAGYQWIELLQVSAGGSTLCAINETLDCATVWNLPFAKSVHRITGLPLAGWGIVWGLMATASAASALAVRQPSAFWSQRLVGTVGLVACVVFFGVSLSAQTWCLTCLTTYALVAAYTVLAWRLPAPAPQSWLPVVLPPGLSLVVGGVLVRLVMPAIPVPVDMRLPEVAERQAEPKSERPSAKSKARAPQTLDAFLSGLPSAARAGLSEALADYRASVIPDGFDAAYVERGLRGSESAPVRLIDFVDVACGHCKDLHENLSSLRRAFEDEKIAVETRFFPLDGACNAGVSMSSGDALSPRCAGAKALICAEGQSGYEPLLDAIFDNQRRLTTPLVIDLAASKTGRSKDDIRACLSSADTEAKLKADVDLAELFAIKGTPLVVINGKEAVPSPPLLYALILAAGDPSAPALTNAGL